MTLYEEAILGDIVTHCWDDAEKLKKKREAMLKKRKQPKVHLKSQNTLREEE